MQQLSGLDAAFLNLESADTPMHVGALTVLDLSGAPEGFGFESVRERVAERLRVVPSFRRRLLSMPLNLVPPLWIEDPAFLLDHHVHHLKLDPPGSDRQLADLVAELFSRPLERSRPLWAFYYVEGLSRHRAACITIVHHACIDGVSGAELLGKLLDPSAEGRRDAPADTWEFDDEPSAFSRFMLAARETGEHLGRITGLVRETHQALQRLRHAPPASPQAAAPGPVEHDSGLGIGAAPATRFNDVIDSSRSYAFRSFSLGRLKKAKNALGITVNDALMVVCAGALRRYLLEKDELPDQPLVAAVPISVRTQSDQGDGGNHVSMLTAKLPTNLSSPRKRVEAMTRSTAALKHTHKSMPARLLMDWLEIPAPGLVAGGAKLWSTSLGHHWFRMPVNLVISNIPGPRQTLYMAGARVLSNYPVSIPFHGLALNITAMSYCGHFDVGLTACRRAVPDLDHLMKLFAESLKELEALAMAEVE